MPKNARKRKGKAANPIAVPSLEIRPRYQTPAPETPSDAQQLPTPKATPAKARVVEEEPEEEPEEESEPTVEELQRWLATQVRLKKFEEKEREKVERGWRS